VNQVARPAELILVDDASADEGRTLATLHELEQRYASELAIEVVVLEKNGGPSAARNAGWDRANQPYVAFLDADDSWHPEKLYVQFEWMQAHPDVALSGHVCANPERPLVGEVPAQYEVTPINKKHILLRNPFSTPSVMIRSEIPLRFQAGKAYAEDFFLWQQVVCSGYQVVRLEVVLAELHKATYGDSGLSSHLWAMELAELDNYKRLKQQRCIHGLHATALSIYSLVKWLRRLLIVSIRRFAKVN